MTITVVNVGTAAHANDASVVPGLPAGHTANDILIAFDALRADGTIAATGYTEIATDGSTSHRLTALKKTDGGSETDPTLAITGTGNSHSAVVAAIRGSSGVVDGTPQTDVSGNVDLTISYPALTVNENGCIVWLFISHNDDLASGSLTFDTPSGFTKLGEWDTTLGSDHSLAVYYQIQTAAANIGAGTVTKSGGADATSMAMIFALRADVEPQPPDWTTAPTVTAETTSAYTLSFETTEACTVYAVAVPKDSAVPSIAQVKTGQSGSGTNANGADSKSVAADTADTLTLTIDDATPFPLYDIYAVASSAYGDSTLTALPDEFLDPATGKQFVTLASVDDTSPLYGQSVVAGDIWILDTLSDPDDYAIAGLTDGNFTIDAGSDESRQSFAHDVYDVSAVAYVGAGLIWINNAPPDPGEAPFVPSWVLPAGVPMAPVDLELFATDIEGDAITTTVSGTLPDGLEESNGVLTGTPTRPGEWQLVVRWTDAIGEYSEETLSITVVGAHGGDAHFGRDRGHRGWKPRYEEADLDEALATTARKVYRGEPLEDAPPAPILPPVDERETVLRARSRAVASQLRAQRLASLLNSRH